MLLEWIKTLGPLIISWPVVGLIAILMFRKPLRSLADSFTSQDVHRVKFGGFELERVKAEVIQAKSQIDQLYALSMSDDMFYQLKTLSTGSYGAYWLDPDLKVGLAPELNFLKMLGYIKFDRDVSVQGVEDLPKGDHPEGRLSQYISVTSQGHQFIILREQALRGT